MWVLFTTFELYFAFFYFNDVSGRGSCWIYIVINSVHNTFAMLLFTNRERTEDLEYVGLFPRKIKIQTRKFPMEHAKIIYKEHWIPCLISSTEMFLPGEYKHT